MFNRLHLLALAAIASSFVATTLTGFGEEKASTHPFLPATLETPDGESVSSENLKGKTIGLYFSAHWCPPCRAFTPKLVDFRNENADGDFEVVFVSFDHSEGDKETYIEEASMPWPSITGASSDAAQALAGYLQVQGFPTLVIISPEGKVLSMNGRMDVLLTPKKALEKWKAAEQS